MLWINLIHLYQPANIDNDKIIEATHKSYLRLLRLLEENKNLEITANIAGCLVERWATDMKRLDIIERFKAVVDEGRLELVGSASYHAILPLVSELEALRQIKDQERILKNYFGIKKVKGFFFPEMAYGVKIAKLLKKLGYEWIIVDEITAFGKIGNATSDVYEDSNSGLKIIIRDRIISETYIPDTIFEKTKLGDESTIITVTDAELYGLRHIDHTAELEKVVKSSKLETQTVSHFISHKKILKKIKLLNSNWQSTEKDLLNNLPYALWQNSKNIIQTKLWELADLAQDLNNNYRRDKNILWSDWHLSRGLASCSWWWSSGHDFRNMFGPLAWSPDETEKGITELLKAIRSLEASTSIENKLKAERLAQRIRNDLWRKHWQKTI